MLLVIMFIISITILLSSVLSQSYDHHLPTLWFTLVAEKVLWTRWRSLPSTAVGVMYYSTGRSSFLDWAFGNSKMVFFFFQCPNHFISHIHLFIQILHCNLSYFIIMYKLYLGARQPYPLIFFRLSQLLISDVLIFVFFLFQV